MFSQFYGLGQREGWARVDELIAAVGLDAQARQKVSSLSTGERQKLNLARGLLNDPWILFLDEPTLGLDVSAARAVRELVQGWQKAVPGRTILLTSHYMAEVDELCDRLAIVDHGRILAIGTSAELKKRVQRESIFLLEVDRLPGGTPALSRVPGVVSAVKPSASDLGAAADRQTVQVKLTLADDAALSGVVAELGRMHAAIVALTKSEPTLEDVFVELVGRGFQESESDEEGNNDRPTQPPANHSDTFGPPPDEPMTTDSSFFPEPVESAR
jgi:ABC-2 type transport system ATP-binding protein